MAGSERRAGPAGQTGSDAVSEFLPYGRQQIDDRDIDAVVTALRSEFLTTGPLVAKLEELVAEYCGAKYAIVCNSGTAALHLAVAATGFGPGDVALVPAITFLATANVARLLGGDVAFVDVDPLTGRMRAQDLEEAMPRAKALGHPKVVLPVHLGGESVSMPDLQAAAAEHGLLLIEDACHALGGDQLRKDGSFGRIGGCESSDACCFSFHPVKAVTTGEGGVVLTNSQLLAGKAAQFRNHGMTRDAATFRRPQDARDAGGSANPWYYEQHVLGLNYRLPDINCALGISQFGRLEEFLARRRMLVARYLEQIGRLAPWVRPVDGAALKTSGWHLFACHIDFSKLNRTRSQLMAGLRERGVGSQVHYIPVNRQPYYCNLYGELSLPGADAYYSSCLSLPLFPAMGLDDVDRVVNALAQELGQGDGTD